MATVLLLKGEVYAIVGAAIEVHRELGPGFLEPVYQEAIEIELARREIPFESAKRLQIRYKGQVLQKEYIADLVCYGQVIVELKALDRLSGKEEAQILNYLKATGIRVGVLINFGSHPKLEWKRLVWRGRATESLPCPLRVSSCPSWIDLEVAEMLENLSLLKEGCSRRVSSWDTTGRNADAWHVAAGETKTLADVAGAGVIRHIWFTISCEDPLYLRKCILRMYWDGQEHPSAEAPVGDFFGVGHSKVSSFSCAVLNMSANPGQDRHAAMNCYFPMPFARGARITVQNECEVPVHSWYFYVDYDVLDTLPAEQARFHAHWRRTNPCPPPTHQGDDPDVNLTDRDNYLILDTEGRGHYVGCNLSVHNLYGGWWGEGDDMIMVDGEKWPPDMHGTGSEDYFSHAWGMQIQNAFLYNGVSYHAGANMGFNERVTVYRYHVADPVVFRKSLRVSIEHGHANDRSDDYSSTAYWYQTLPGKPFPPLPKMEERLPRPDAVIQPVDLPIPVTDRRRSGSPIDPALVPRKS